VDPSGGSADSFTLAVGHMEADGTAVLDCIREVRPPFSPDAVVEEFAALLKSYRVARVHGDAYAGMWPRERFSTHGITYEVSTKNKSAIYLEFLPALNGQRVRLLDIPRLISQLVTLERRTARGGKDSIDHEQGAHDDVANAACGCLVQVIEDRRPALIKQADLLVEDQPAAEIAFPQTFFATVWVGVDGMCAFALFGYTDFETVQLVLMDFDMLPWTDTLLDDVARRLDTLCEEAFARNERCRNRGVNALLLTQGQLQRAAFAAMYNAFALRLYRHDAHLRAVTPVEIDERLLADAANLVLVASALVASGRVKMSATATARAAGRPLLGSLAIKAGEDVTSDPLRVALLVGIAELDSAQAPMVAGAAIRFG
jgi:hypothetical protein